MIVFRLEHWDDTPRDVRDRKKDLYGMIVHGTGSTVVERAMKQGHNPNHEAAEHYDKPKANFPNFLICWEAQNETETGWTQMLEYGTDISVADGEDMDDADVYGISRTDADQAWTSATGEVWNHIYRRGFAEWSRYIRGDDKQPVDTGEVLDRYAWWNEQWAHLGTNPADLIPGRNDNANTMSCEIVVPIQPVERRKRRRPGWKRIPFTARQLDVMAWLWAGKFWVYGLPMDEVERRIVGHSDVNPIGRSKYDPGRGKWFDWAVFFERFRYWFDVFKDHPNPSTIVPGGVL